MKEKIKTYPKNVVNFLKNEYKFLFLLIIIFLLFYVELPYKVYSPGGMVDLGSRVSVEDGYSSDGKMGMAYVSMIRGSLPYLALSYVIPDWDMVPQEELKYENETMEERLLADKIATQESIDQAIIAAYKQAGKEITVYSEIVHVTYIDPRAKTDIKILDTILKVEGQEIKSTKELKELISSYQEGDQVEIVVKRNEKEVVCHAKVFEADGPKVGIGMTLTYEYEEHPKSSITMKQSESGPSGGLMMSLAIYNSLVEEDITKGKTVVGTGTIDVDGNVGEIGGVKYKLIGAVHNKADVFLVPEENYEEAIQVKNEKNYDIRILCVSSLKQAVNELQNLE